MKIKNPLVVPAVLVAVVITVAATVTGCSGKYVEPYQDAPRAGTSDSTAAKVIEMPDGFSNLATKCVGDIRYTVVYHFDNPYGSVSTVVDPQCGK